MNFWGSTSEKLVVKLKTCQTLTVTSSFPHGSIQSEMTEGSLRHCLGTSADKTSCDVKSYDLTEEERDVKQRRMQIICDIFVYLHCPLGGVSLDEIDRSS